jgi:hypothetical protein
MEWTSFRNKLRLKPNSSKCKTKRNIPKRNAKLQWKEQVRVMSHRRKEGLEGGREGRKGWREGGREGGREGKGRGGKEGRKEGDAEKH